MRGKIDWICAVLCLICLLGGILGCELTAGPIQRLIAFASGSFATLFVALSIKHDR